MIHMRQFNKFEERNLTFLVQKSIEFTLVQITEVGYRKGILDATEPMRQYFRQTGMHDYQTQLQGTENKVLMPTLILDQTSGYSTLTSLYRPMTKKGDPRIWPGRMTKHCAPNDILLMIFHDGILYVINLSQVDIQKVCSSPVITPLSDLVCSLNAQAMSVANELEGLLRNLAMRWHSTEVLADTGVGRAIEALLGINMNSDKNPDYKGIELKSAREKRVKNRSTLFTQVPDWSISEIGSAKAIVEKYGYERNGVKTYQNTLSCININSQHLGLTLYQLRELLAIEEKKCKLSADGSTVFKKEADVALWNLDTLHNRLLTKHHETFWIGVESKIEAGREFFRPTVIEHTKNPIVSQFDNLLDSGDITVDLLLCRPGKGGDTVAFKIKPKSRQMLFPDNELIRLI